MSVGALDPREALCNLASCVTLPPRRAIKKWIPDDEPDPDGIDQLVLRSLPDLLSFSDEGGEGVSRTWQAPEIQLHDDRTLVPELMMGKGS